MFPKDNPGRYAARAAMQRLSHVATAGVCDECGPRKWARAYLAVSNQALNIVLLGLGACLPAAVSVRREDTSISIVIWSRGMRGRQDQRKQTANPLLAKATSSKSPNWIEVPRPGIPMQNPGAAWPTDAPY